MALRKAIIKSLYKAIETHWANNQEMQLVIEPIVELTPSSLPGLRNHRIDQLPVDGTYTLIYDRRDSSFFMAIREEPTRWFTINSRYRTDLNPNSALFTFRLNQLGSFDTSSVLSQVRGWIEKELRDHLVEKFEPYPWENAEKLAPIELLLPNLPKSAIDPEGQEKINKTLNEIKVNLKSVETQLRGDHDLIYKVLEQIKEDVKTSNQQELLQRIILFIEVVRTGYGLTSDVFYSVGLLFQFFQDKYLDEISPISTLFIGH